MTNPNFPPSTNLNFQDPKFFSTTQHTTHMKPKKPQTIKYKQTYVIAKEICELLKTDSANGYDPHKIGTEIGNHLIKRFENDEFNFGNDPDLASECIQIILRVALDKIENYSPSNIIPPINPNNRNTKCEFPSNVFNPLLGFGIKGNDDDDDERNDFRSSHIDTNK